jgi:phosphoenolpyruvate carboxykinase (GTP)
MEKKLVYKPKVFSINWFRTDENGKYLWPGFGDNIRVIKWVIDRVHGRVGANQTPIGLTPKIEDLDMSGLDISADNLKKLFAIDKDGWLRETADIEEFFNKFGKRMPDQMREELAKMKAALAGGK